MSIAPYTREEIEEVRSGQREPRDHRYLATVDARDAEIERLRERVAVEHSAGLHAEKVLAETGGKYLRELDRVERMREALIAAREGLKNLRKNTERLKTAAHDEGMEQSKKDGPNAAPGLQIGLDYYDHGWKEFGGVLAKIESALGGDPTKATT